MVTNTTREVLLQYAKDVGGIWDHEGAALEKALAALSPPEWYGTPEYDEWVAETNASIGRINSAIRATNPPRDKRFG